MTIEVFEADGGVGSLFIAHGRLTGDEYVEAVRSHCARDDEVLRREFYNLTDYRAVTKVENFEKDHINMVARLTARIARINHDVVVATVVNSDIMHGLMRMWEQGSGDLPWQISIFRDRPSAVAWIRKRCEQDFGVTGLTLAPGSADMSRWERVLRLRQTP